MSGGSGAAVEGTPVGDFEDVQRGAAGDGARALSAAAWDALFDGADEAARRRGFVELVLASVDVAGVGLWMKVEGCDAWCEAARVGAADERESIALAARRSGDDGSSMLAGAAARGPFGAARAPWFLTVVGLVDDDVADALDALCVLWDHVRVRDELGLDEIRGSRRSNDAA